MYDDPYLDFTDHVPRRGDDDRLRLNAYVDGRLVDSWTEPVEGSRWHHLARRFDAERRPGPASPPAPPRHEQVLRWLDGLVGGRAALLALEETVTVAAPAPVLAGPAAEAAYDAVRERFDRFSGVFLDADARRVLDVALGLLWAASPDAITEARSPATVAGGLLWVVGKANGLFVGGFTQQLVRRELWLKQGLNVPGQALARHLRGLDFHGEPRPHGCPDLTAFARPELLTTATRRAILQWRDAALALTEQAVLPTEVES